MVKINIIELLNKNQKTKYWLCQKMNIRLKNLNKIIEGETKLISFKYIEQLCTLLNCDPNDLITICDPYIMEKDENNELVFM